MLWGPPDKAVLLRQQLQRELPTISLGMQHALQWLVVRHMRRSMVAQCLQTRLNVEHDLGNHHHSFTEVYQLSTQYVRLSSITTQRWDLLGVVQSPDKPAPASHAKCDLDLDAFMGTRHPGECTDGGVLSVVITFRVRFIFDPIDA